MITGTSANYDAVVSGTDVTGVAWRMQMTLPAGPYSDVSLAIESVEIDASTTSDMPEDTRLQVGYPAMQATIVLSGQVDETDELKTARWLFSQYPIKASDGTVSPLYQKDALYVPVTVDAGLATDAAAGTPTQGAIEWVRKFTGYVDLYVVNADGSIQFTCLESMRQQLRGAATLPPLFNTTVTTEYLIDALLRADTDAAVSSWPAPVNEALLSVGFRAAPLAEIGDLFNDYGSTYAPGVFGSALAGGSNLRSAPFVSSGGPSAAPFVAADYLIHTPYVLGGGQYGLFPNQVTTSPNMFCSFWADGDVSTVFPQILFSRAPSGNLGGSWSPNWIRLTVKSTGLVVESSQFATQTWSTTVSAGPHYIAWWMKSNAAGSTLDITVVLDGTAHTFTQLAVSIGDVARNYVAVGWSAATGIASTIEALQISSNNSGAPYYDPGLLMPTFTPKAVLDPSLNSTLRVVNQVAGDTYSVIQQLADAELAVAGGDETGMFRFLNRNTLRSANSVRTVTSAASLVGVGGIQTAAASVKNHCTVDWSGWDLASTATIIYQATSPIRVPAGQTVVLTPTLTAPAVLYGNVAVGFPTLLPDGSSGAGFWYRASTSKSGTKTFTGKASISMRQPAADRLEITIANKSTTDMWLVSSADYLDVTAGTPLLQIWGNAWAVTSATADYQYPGINADGSGGAASTRFGDQPHPISGNPWIQDPIVADQLTKDIVVDLCNPRPDLTGVEIVPDPRLQLADVIRLQDPDWSGVDEYARIFGWKIAWNPTNFTMELDARTLAPPGGWIMGVSGRSEVGTTTYVYPSV